MSTPCPDMGQLCVREEEKYAFARFDDYAPHGG